MLLTMSMKRFLCSSTKSRIEFVVELVITVVVVVVVVVVIVIVVISDKYS